MKFLLENATNTKWIWDADNEAWVSNTKTGREVLVFETNGKWKIQMSGWNIKGVSILNKYTQDEMVEIVKKVFIAG